MTSTPDKIFPKRKAVPIELPHAYITTIDGKQIEAGEQITVDGESGLFKFKYVYLRDGSIVCWGGPSGHERTRSFQPARCHIKKAPRKKPQLSDEQLEVLKERLAKARAMKAEKK